MASIENRYINVRQTVKYTGIHFNSMKNLIKVGKFPKPIRLIPKLVRFDRVVVSMVMSGVSLESIERMTQRELMEAFDSGDYTQDQNDPEQGDSE